MLEARKPMASVTDSILDREVEQLESILDIPATELAAVPPGRTWSRERDVRFAKGQMARLGIEPAAAAAK